MRIIQHRTVKVNGAVARSNRVAGPSVNPKRPITTWERFQRARVAAQELTAEAEARVRNPKTGEGQAAAEADRVKWLRAELGLVLLEATGRRSGSIRQLRWEDINFNTSEITWRAEADKKRQQWNTPVPASLLEEIRAFRSKLSVVAGLVFPAEKTPTEPIGRDVFARWILALEKRAGLAKLDGGLLHTFRRKWATERKDLPLKDVAAAGGWKDVGTLLTCYQQADWQTMLAVMSEPRKVTEASVTGTSNCPKFRTGRKTRETREKLRMPHPPKKKPHNVSRCGA